MSLKERARHNYRPVRNGNWPASFTKTGSEEKRDWWNIDFDAFPVLNVDGRLDEWNSQRADLFFYEGPVVVPEQTFSYRIA